jgi:hypothetical protein
MAFWRISVGRTSPANTLSQGEVAALFTVPLVAVADK